jgi:hypothetical protein
MSLKFKTLIFVPKLPASSSPEPGALSLRLKRPGREVDLSLYLVPWLKRSGGAIPTFPYMPSRRAQEKS